MKWGYLVDEFCVEGGIMVYNISIVKYLNELYFSIYDIRFYYYLYDI